MDPGTQSGHDLLDPLAAGAWAIDADGVTTYVNPAMLAMLGQPPESVLDHSFLDSFHPDDRATVQDAVRRRRSGASDHYDARLLNRTGAVLHVRVHGAPLFREGVHVGSIAIVTDISDLVGSIDREREGHQIADRASRAKSRFLSWASHELRTPLTTIAGFAGLIEHAADEPAQQRMAASITTAAAHLNGLVQDLLDYSRAEAEMLAPALETLDVREVVDAAVALAAGSAHAQQVVIDTDVPTLWVVADRRHLVQAILNLLSNAVKYGGKGSRVRVAVTPHGQRVHVAITDQGPGIPAELQQRIFRPFERLDTDVSVDGVGLGLPIADAFVRAMHGSLTLDSRPGHGATFVIDVPAGDAPGSAAPADRPAPDTRPPLVLYVEDEPLNAALVENIVGFLPGRTLHVEPTVAGGIQAVLSMRPTLVLLDLNLPDGSGLDVLRAVREHPELRETPVYILSADATEQSASKALAAGADRFITKPFNLKEFLDLLESAT